IHPRIGEKQSRIIFWNQRRRGNNGMSVFFEVVDKRASNLRAFHKSPFAQFQSQILGRPKSEPRGPALCVFLRRRALKNQNTYSSQEPEPFQAPNHGRWRPREDPFL